jgi:hypothetical protein
MSGPFTDEARTRGSSAATGIDEHVKVTFGGLGCADDGAGECDGEAFGLGVGDGVGEGVACDTVTSEGDGDEAMWLVGPGLPHADTTVATAIAMPIRSRLMYQQR